MHKPLWLLGHALLVLIAASIGLRGCQQVGEDHMKPVRQHPEFKQMQQKLREK